MNQNAVLRLYALLWGVAFFFFGLARAAETPDLYFTEVHHCPAEPEPEWVEVYNASGGPLPVEEYRFCNRAKNWSASQGKTRTKRDTLAAYETVIFTRDTLLSTVCPGIRGRSRALRGLIRRRAGPKIRRATRGG